MLSFKNENFFAEYHSELNQLEMSRKIFNYFKIVSSVWNIFSACSQLCDAYKWTL